MAKYVAYVSSYTQGNKFGITIYDVDTRKGRFIYKDRILISNSSYLTISHNRKYLYSITDFGVESYLINADGSLAVLNMQSINGMRGCHLSTSYDDAYLFVAGYHDGKITALKINEDGTVGEITDEIFLKGMGSLADRNYHPHVNCVKMTRDDKFLLAADLSMDHVNVYSLDHATGKLKLVDIIRSDQDSEPSHIKISKDGKYIYIIHELKNYIDVYSYTTENNVPFFEKIQTISSVNDYHSSDTAACALNLSPDNKLLISSSAGDNSVSIYKMLEGGKIERLLCLPISGDYPKDCALFPGNKHLVSCNHESDTLTFFTVDLEACTIVMNGPEIHLEKPNCIIMHKLPDEA